ncbi:helix-turn-helix transcriptional regulator [Pseudophaeobacter sp.]|uniref:helix-turn-helix transcriptional regulator n=1 Tax=Pseudophaeobacter sp. TaxID=1971739 RepID=UPI00405983AA
MEQLDTAQAQALAKTIADIGTPSFEASLDAWLGLTYKIDNVTMMAFFDDRRPEVYYSHAKDKRVFEKLNSEYVRGVYLLDPAYALHTESAEEGLYRLHDIAPDQFQRNEYYATYYRRTTLIDEVIYFVRPSPGVSVTVCVGRDASSGRKFSAHMFDRLRNGAPIVLALASRHWENLRSEKPQDVPQVVEILRERVKQDKGIALSPRQSEIAFLILQGHSSVSIGLLLGISPQTVKVIRKQLYRKCEISSQAELFSLLTPFLLGM